MTQPPQLFVGALVTVDDHRTPGLYKIVNKGPKNWSLTPVNADGSSRIGRGARFPDYMLHLVTDPAAVAEQVPFTPYPMGADLHPGVLVRFAKDGLLYVVLADKGVRVNIALLGGDEKGRYWRAPRSGLTVIPREELAAAL